MTKKIIAGLIILTTLALVIIPIFTTPIFALADPVAVDPMAVLARVVELARTALILVGVLFIMIGAILFATAAGDDKKVEKGRKAIMVAMIAIVIGAVAHGIVVWIRDFILE